MKNNNHIHYYKFWFKRISIELADWVYIYMCVEDNHTINYTGKRKRFWLRP